MRRTIFSPCVAVACLLAPAIAIAEPAKGSPEGAAAAQSLFAEARALMQKAAYAEACPKLEESLRLDAGLGTQFNLADCNEHIGKIASAWAGFLDVAASAKASRQAEREKLARKRALALEPRLPKLVIEADANANKEGLEIARDGNPVGAPSWGAAIAVDPGAHDVVASAPGKRSWRTVVQTFEGQTTRVAVPRDLPVAVEATRSDAAPARAAQQPTTVRQPVVTEFPEPIVEKPGSTQRTLGFVVGGVGLAGLAIGGGFGLSSLSKRSDAEGHCNADDACDPTGLRLRDDALRAGNVATIATIAGGAALAGGILLVLTAPGGDRKKGSLKVAPQVAAGGGALLLKGTFQ